MGGDNCATEYSRYRVLTDSSTEKMLQEYRQLGLLFTYNIDVEPQFCYNNKIVFSLVMLESVADFFLEEIVNCQWNISE